MSARRVVVERAGRVGAVRLDRPGKLNALDPAMFEGLRAAFADFERDTTVFAVLLEGAGRSFCAGGDQGEGAQPERDAFGWYEYLHVHANRLLEDLLRFPKPIVAAVQGHAFGAGMCLALVADMVVAAEDAQFCMPYTRIGLTPDFGALYLLPRRVPSLSVAKDIVLTARTVHAQEALRLGLANRLAPAAELRSVALALATELGSGPSQALQLSKAILDRSLDADLGSVLAMEAMAHGIIKPSRDHAEGVAAFRARRRPSFTEE